MPRRRLNPLDPLLFGIKTGIAAARFLARRYDEASAWAEEALREWPKFRPAMRWAAASHALAGRLAQAEQATARMREIDPSFRISDVKDVAPVSRRRFREVHRGSENRGAAGGMSLGSLKRPAPQQLLGLFQIARIMPLSKPSVDRRERLTSLIPLALIAPEPGEAYCRAQFPTTFRHRSTTIS